MKYIWGVDLGTNLRVDRLTLGVPLGTLSLGWFTVLQCHILVYLSLVGDIVQKYHNT